ncbi:MAG: NERD domain-containing protein [Planctomycetia bacterium]|nr:NERD domain-containing protein [Planctomycetia bacterium]
MARMIPPTIHSTVRSGAERQTFAILRDAPGTDDWVCLHSLSLAKHDSKRRAEIDFVLLTRQGIFVLEVKGGRISRRDGVWTYTDRWDNSVSKSESPFDQASSAMFSLERDIRDKFSDHKHRRRLLFGFAAMFPDITFDVDGVEIDPRQVYDRRSRGRCLTDFIRGLADYWRERSTDSDGKPTKFSPSEADIAAVVEFLRGDFDLVPSIGALADESSRQFLSLEKEQYAVLDGLEMCTDPNNPNPRFIIQGGAGTGKTLLAAEVARREAATTNGDVLLICFNRVLQSVLEHRVRAATGGRIVVKSIGVLLNELITSSSFADEFNRAARGADSTTLYRDIMPAFATNAVLEGKVQPFSSVIVDEAQDMMSNELLDLLEPFVEGGFKYGRWWVFCDMNNQESVFGVFEQDALFRLMGYGRVSILPTNRRNTIPIANETDIVTRPKYPPRATVDGIPVKTRFYKSVSEQVDLLSSILKALKKEDVSAYQITVLSTRKAADCCAAKLANPRFTLITKDNAWKIGSPTLDDITYCTVSSFKGLENDFIVLTDVDELNTDWWKGVVYVGMSRARTGLLVLMNDMLKEAYNERQQMWLREHHGDAR